MKKTVVKNNHHLAPRTEVAFQMQDKLLSWEISKVAQISRTTKIFFTATQVMTPEIMTHTILIASQL